MRIISLIPAATEIISSLGLINKLVGVSHECDFPSLRVESTQLGSRVAITSQKEDLKLAFTEELH